MDQWFDPTRFSAVPVGSYRFGSSGRNILDGPGTVNINAGLSRRFRFAESRVVQFRLESQNLPNHPNFNLPETRVDIISGGTITRAKNNRMLTFGSGILSGWRVIQDLSRSNTQNDAFDFRPTGPA